MPLLVEYLSYESGREAAYCILCLPSHIFCLVNSCVRAPVESGSLWLLHFLRHTHLQIQGYEINGRNFVVSARHDANPVLVKHHQSVSQYKIKLQ